MSNIDIFIRLQGGERQSLASLENASEVRGMWDLLREVGVYDGGTLARDIGLQAFIDELETGFEFIVMTE